MPLYTMSPCKMLLCTMPHTSRGWEAGKLLGFSRSRTQFLYFYLLCALPSQTWLSADTSNLLRRPWPPDLSSLISTGPVPTSRALLSSLQLPPCDSPLCSQASPTLHRDGRFPIWRISSSAFKWTQEFLFVLLTTRYSAVVLPETKWVFHKYLWVERMVLQQKKKKKIPFNPLPEVVGDTRGAVDEQPSFRCPPFSKPFLPPFPKEQTFLIMPGPQSGTCVKVTHPFCSSVNPPFPQRRAFPRRRRRNIIYWSNLLWFSIITSEPSWGCLNFQKRKLVRLQDTVISGMSWKTASEF